MYICAAKVFECLFFDEGAMRPMAVDAMYVYLVSRIILHLFQQMILINFLHIELERKLIYSGAQIINFSWFLCFCFWKYLFQNNERYNPGGAEVDATGNESEQVALRQQAIVQQQQQKDSQPIAGEDTRFAMPSETPLASVVSQQIKSTGNEVTYVEASFANATANDAITQPNSEEHELETRLK